MFNSAEHDYWMQKALKLANKASTYDEVPVGAILVNHRKRQIVSTGFNLRESLHTPLGHAELLAIHRAAKKQQSWRLTDCTLYVTLEPCLMCAGTILQARIPQVVFGASDPKGGAVQSLYQVFSDPRLNHQVNYQGGVLEDECGRLLQTFFKNKRRRARLDK